MLKQGVCAVLLLGFLTCPASYADQALDTALDAVTGTAIRAHMAFLADDLLEGREAGTRGYELAAHYVATQFEALGLKPAGDGSSWFQPLDLRRSVQVEEGCSFSLHADTTSRVMEYGVDYFMRGDPTFGSTTVEAAVVYVGYGVTAPDMQYDDYAGVNVKGKIVVMLRGAPPTFPHNQRAYYSREKLRTAEKKGAVGVLAILNPEDTAKRPWDRRMLNSKIAQMRLMDTEGVPIEAFPKLQVRANLSAAGTEALFAGAPQSLEAIYLAAESGKPNSFDLPWRAKMSRQSKHRNVQSKNVVAVLEGSDPTLRKEYLVYTAHLDHLGIGEPKDGDRIYNGAFDNASGVAVMLEVARAFCSMPTAPKRSVIFLAVTAEEKGLLGSQFYAEFPTVPIKSIVANINLDMFLMLHPLKDLVAFGAEHTSLEATVRDAVFQLGIELSPDPMPEEVIFVRSDQYSFVRKGVPAVFLTAGSMGQEPGGANTASWIRERYHSQSDDMTQPMVLQAGIDFTRANILIGHEVANASSRPKWNEGDFFGKLFAGKRNLK